MDSKILELIEITTFAFNVAFLILIIIILLSRIQENEDDDKS